MLSGFGCAFVSAANGKEAVEIFSSSKDSFSLIFMDVHMPVLDGISATKRVRKIEAQGGLNSIPIIGATADCETNAIREMKEAGMTSIVFKPYRIEYIKTALAQYLTK